MSLLRKVVFESRDARLDCARSDVMQMRVGIRKPNTRPPVGTDRAGISSGCGSLPESVQTRGT